MNTRMVTVVRKELREIRRDPITLWIAFALPVVMLFVFGYAISFDIKDVRFAVLDHDHTAASLDLIDAFNTTESFELRYQVDSEREIAELLDRGAIRLALIVPSGFQSALQRGDGAVVQTLIDGSFSATAAVIRSQADAVVQTYTTGLQNGAKASLVEPRVWYNPDLDSATFVVPGLFAVILMAFPPLLTVLAIVREKESGSVQQVYVSPLRSWEFVGGKMIPYVAIAFAEMAIILGLGVWWFRIPFRGNPAVFALGAALYVLCTVGIGLLISTVTRSQVIALLLAVVVTVMPSMLFSGFMYPIFTMPDAVQWYTRIFPARYFTDVSRGVTLKGTGLAQLAPQLGLLAGYTALVFAAASLRFRKKVM